MFAIILDYLKSPQDVPGVVEAHKAWADDGVKRGVFVLSGPKRQGGGGMILAHGLERDELDALIEADPFRQNGICSYTIIELAPRTGDPRLAFLFAK